MTIDRIENINGGVVQHGTLSDRAYLMHFDGARPQRTAGRLDKLAQEKGYGKIIAKVPASAAQEFLEQGFQQEAAIPGFYKGAETALFLVRYQNLSRACDRNKKKSMIF
jgi:beta-lysine N6-acetyltransferase